jgi:7-carboxy-7-deazaguanine synthase
MNINEIFLSIQGEGLYTGEKMIFIRTEYCNLRCSWCDTKYSFNEGREMSLNEIIDIVNEMNKDRSADWICLTGGEPLLQRDANNLVNNLSKNYRILLETSGSLDIKQFLPDYGKVKMDIDFKLPSSGMYGKFNYRNIQYMMDGDYLKFVVSDKNDLSVALGEIEKLDRRIQIVIQPAYGTDVRWLADEFIKFAPSNTRLMLQEHKYIYGDIRGV